MRCHNWNAKATTEVYKPYLSFFISFSFSCLSHSVHRLSLSSLTSSTLNTKLNTHSLYARRMKHCQSYFIVLTVRTRDVQNHDRLKWLLNCILSFSQSVHTMYETMTDFRQCGACSGSPQLHCKCLWSMASVGYKYPLFITFIHMVILCIINNRNRLTIV